MLLKYITETITLLVIAIGNKKVTDSRWSLLIEVLCIKSRLKYPRNHRFTRLSSNVINSHIFSQSLQLTINQRNLPCKDALKLLKLISPFISDFTSKTSKKPEYTKPNSLKSNWSKRKWWGSRRIWVLPSISQTTRTSWTLESACTRKASRNKKNKRGSVEKCRRNLSAKKRKSLFSIPNWWLSSSRTHSKRITTTLPKSYWRRKKSSSCMAACWMRRRKWHELLTSNMKKASTTSCLKLIKRARK